MKIALCISGFVRTFEQTFPCLEKYLLRHNDIDIFISTWDISDRHEGLINKNRIVELYKPKQFIEERIMQQNIPAAMIEKNNGGAIDINGLICMFYKIKYCNDLKSQFEKENGFIYDCVIRFRFDIKLENKLIINENILNNIYIPMFGDFAGLNDQMAYGSSHNMNIYSSAYDHLSKYINDVYVLNPELLMKEHIVKSKLNIKRFILNYKLLCHGLEIDNWEKQKLFEARHNNRTIKMHNIVDKNNKYSQMQEKQYDSEASQWSPAPDKRDFVVGSFDAHNAWKDYDDFLFNNIENKENKTALDFGCGPGRNIVKFSNRFKQIDGVDISAINLQKAKTWFDENHLEMKPNLFKSNGIDLAEITSEKYDVVFSTICLQHICVYDIRYSLLKEFYRVLKSNGSICLQMGYGKGHPNTVGYYENNYDAIGTNSFCDTRVDDTLEVKNDLEEIGFVNFTYDIRPTGPGDRHQNWIFFRALKK